MTQETGLIDQAPADHFREVKEMVKGSEILVVDEGLFRKELMWQMSNDKSLAEYAETALEVLRPYLRTTKPVSVSLEKGAAANYNDYFGGKNKWPDATDNERRLYIDGVRATAKAWGLSHVD